MISFDDIKELIDKNHICKIQMPRKKEILNNYKKFRETLDYEAFEKIIFNSNKSYSIRKNDFPYDIEPNISHYILWIKDESLSIEDIIFSSFKIDKKENILWYRNLPENRSIKSIIHYHIFILNTVEISFYKNLIIS